MVSALALVLFAPAPVINVVTPVGAFPQKLGRHNRVVVYFGRGEEEPRFGPDWFNPKPTLSVRPSGVKAGQTITLTEANITSFPRKLADIEPGEYNVQAVVDLNLGGRTIGASPGNLYSKPVRIKFPLAKPLTLRCNQRVPEPTFRSTPRTQEVAVVSSLLTRFYGRRTMLRAAVNLPGAYAQNIGPKFPVIYEVPGFGGNHYSWSNKKTAADLVGGKPFIRVVLNPDCPTGHSVFADSAVNGPWGEALTTELIPAIERRFRALGTPQGRLLRGHSSGGWSTLWLQVNYPSFFGGTWSTSPDPVDFRDFQRMNIYRPNENAFVDSEGKPRPLARQGDSVLVNYQPFNDMERPIRGEQLGSFHAVFGVKDKNGDPIPLWNPLTGAIDAAVAEQWKKYDIGLILRRDWPKLERRLSGKIHVYMGTEDTFYLEGATRLLQSDLRRMKAKATVELFPGDHGSVMTPELISRIEREMAAVVP